MKNSKQGKKVQTPVKVGVIGDAQSLRLGLGGYTREFVAIGEELATTAQKLIGEHRLRSRSKSESLLKSAFAGLIAAENATTDFRTTVVTPLATYLQQNTADRRKRRYVELRSKLTKFDTLLSPEGRAPIVQLEVQGLTFVEVHSTPSVFRLPKERGFAKVIFNLDLYDPDQYVELLRFVAAERTCAAPISALVLTRDTIGDAFGDGTRMPPDVVNVLTEHLSFAYFLSSAPTPTIIRDFVFSRRA